MVWMWIFLLWFKWNNFFCVWIVNLWVGVMINFWIMWLFVLILLSIGKLKAVVFFVFVCVCLIMFFFVNVNGIVFDWIGVVFLKFVCFIVDNNFGVKLSFLNFKWYFFRFCFGKNDFFLVLGVFIFSC